MLTVLCHTADDDGNSFSDEDIVNHMIFLMMAAHDTTTSTVTTMIYHLAAHQDWQDRARTNRPGMATRRWTSRPWKSWRPSTW